MSELPDDIAALLAADREIPPAPAGVPERVALRLERTNRARRLRSAALVMAPLAAAALVTLYVWARGTARGEHGRVTASDVPTEARLATRAVASLAGGAELSWDIDADGNTVVEQPRGNVRYAVGRGGAFDVATPAATVSVRGTIFRVEVDPMKTATLERAGLGATVIGAILVTVYEGRVLIANERGHVELTASERGVAQPGGVPTRVDDDVTTRPAAHRGQTSDPRGKLRLEGLVLGEDDAPVEDATVAVNSVPPRKVRTAADGSFAFDELLPQPYDLTARLGERFAGPVTARLTATSEPVTMRLRRGGVLEVDVVDEAKHPVDRATVDLDGRRISANADGVARFEGLGPGWYTVRVQAPGFSPAGEQVRLLGIAGDIERRTFALAHGAAMSGVVVDVDHTPIAAATVLARGLQESFGDAVAEATTDAAGRFQFAALPAATLRFVASDGDHASGSSAPVTLDGVTERTGVTIELTAGGRIAGRVVTAAGGPAPYATVRVGGWRSVGGFDTPTLRQVIADERGAFEVKGLPRAEVQLLAFRDSAAAVPQRLDLTARAAIADLRVVLDTDGAITGVVVDGDGQPVGDAQVNAVPDPADRDVYAFVRATQAAVTDQGGAFELRGLAAGTWRVSALRPDDLIRPPSSWDRDGTPIVVGTRNARIRIDDPAEIRGRVALAGDRAVGRYAVSLDHGPAREFASASGAFRLRDVRAGRHHLRITGAFVTHELPVVVEAGASVDAGTIIVARGRVVRGRVVDAAGAPVAGADVMAGERLITDFDDQLSKGHSARSASDGSFEIAGLPATPFGILARHTSGTASPRSVPAGTEEVRIELALAAPGALEGRVLRGATPVAAVVTADPEGGESQTVYMTQSGPDGRYRFERLSPGKYRVRANRPGTSIAIGVGAPLSIPEVVSGAAAQADLAMPGGPIVSIDVTGPTGARVPAMVHLVDSNLRPTAAELAALAGAGKARGRFFGGASLSAEFIDVAPGAYNVCTQLTQNKLDIAKLPVVCTEITVAADPDRQRFTVPGP